MSVFLERYKKEISPYLVKLFNIKNPHNIPSLKKITLSMALGQDGSDKKILAAAIKELTLISGRKPVVSKAKKSIAAFKLREGQNIGVFVTLRGKHMYYFLETLVHFVLVSIKDFKGIPSKSVNIDNYKSMSITVKDQISFPVISYENVVKQIGVNISFNVNSNSKEETVELLKQFKIPIID